MTKTAFGFGKAMPFHRPPCERALTTTLRERTSFPAGVQKIVLVMKLTVVLLFAALFSAHAEGTAQQVTLSGKNLTLQQVFSAVKKQTGYVVFGNEELFSVSSTFSLSANKVPLNELLETVLKDLPFEYSISGKTVFISRLRSSLSAQQLAYHQLIMNTAPPPIRIQVTDAGGIPLAGASVTNKTSGISLATDQKGSVVMSVNIGDELELQFVGFEKRTVTVKGIATLFVRLTPEVSSLNEAVVNGIYKRPVQNYTGAAQTYTVDELRKVNNTNILAALRSLDASFQMPSDLNFGSDPNHLPQMQVRGSNSIANTDLTSQYGYVSNPPLFILDGFEVPLQKIYDLDMNRVSRLTILKDAAATAIYGSKAANGVLVIETLQPKKGKLRLSYNNNLSINMPDLTSYHLLNSMQKLELEKAAGVYNTTVGLGIAGQETLDQLYHRRRAEAQRGVNTYWLSQPLKTAFGHKHSIYLEGGDDYMRYGADLSYNNNAGVMKGSSRDNLSGGVHLIYRKNNLQFTNYLSVSYNKAKNSPYGDFSQYAKINPYWRVLDSTSGKIAKVLQGYDDPTWSTMVYNPMYNTTLKTENSTSYTNIIDNFQADWTIRPEFKLSARFSLNTMQNSGTVFLPADAIEFVNTPDSLFSTRGYFRQTKGTTNSFQGDLFLNYSKSLRKHTFYATGGYHAQQDKSYYNTVSVQGFPNDNMNDLLFGLQYPVNEKPTGAENIVRQISYYANLSYVFDQRYLFDVSFRNDGSSLFGSARQYAPFWSVGAGWNLHKESFLHLPAVINRFKLRASFGSTGSQNFPPFAASQTYQYMTTKRYLDNIGASLITLGNTDLKWQQTNKINAGTDIELFNGRMQTTLNYYVETTNGLFTTISSVPSSGFPSYYANLGKVQNKGIEIYLTAFLIKNEKKGLIWSINTNLIHNQNKLLQISEGLKAQNDKALSEQTKSTSPVTAPVLQYKEGQSVSTIYAVRSMGIDPSTGNEILLTRDGKQTYIWDPVDQVPVGDNQPKVNGNIGSNLMYKGFSLNVIMRTELGGQMFNRTLVDRVENAEPRLNVDERVLTDRWKKPGDMALYKGLANIAGETRRDITKASSRFIQKNNNLYCDAITLGYLFPRKLIQNWKLSRLQTYFYINNPFVVSSIRQERGLDYPFARNYALSIQLDL
jgi:TonB-linked SusC/RagA family outer membrane protein